MLRANSQTPNDLETTDSQAMDGGAVRVSGSRRLTDVASSALVRASYPLLAAACEHDLAIAKEGATLAEILAPPTTCVRTDGGVHCVLNAGAACAMREPGTDLHAIIDGGPCWNVSCSATAIALVALDAELEIATADGTRWTPADDFFARLDGALVPEDWPRVLALRLGTESGGGLQRFTPLADDGANPPRICLAATRRMDGEVKLVLGGVAPRPYRVYSSVEEEAMAGGLDEDTIAGLAERALLDAEVDARSAGSVELAAELLRDAIRAIDSLSA